MTQHFTSILDLTAEETMKLIVRAKEMKDARYRSTLLQDKILVMIFEKASTRTRLSFEVAVRHLGGSTIFMTPNESQLGRSEPLRDTARVISRYNDGMIVRTFEEEKIAELVRYGSVPVINALTNEGHPCQVMSDLLTIYERTPDFAALHVAWIGDGNNMANSWIEAAIQLPFTLRLACPRGFEPNLELIEKAKQSGARVLLTEDPKEAAKDADYINTDVWASMGQEREQRMRETVFSQFIVDDAMMALARPGARFMHCLPAHREEEVTEKVLESPASIVFDQAENRLHMQKAILERSFTCKGCRAADQGCNA